MGLLEIARKLQVDENATVDDFVVARNSQTGAGFGIKRGWTPQFTEILKRASVDQKQGETKMGISNEELLRKTGPLTSDDFSFDVASDGSDNGVLGVDQMAAFLRILAADTKMLGTVKDVTSRFSKWQESIIESGGRRRDRSATSASPRRARSRSAPSS
jgi:hypothetical protein